MVKNYPLALILLTALGCCLFLPLQAIQAPETFELANGLKIILSPVENVESVCVLTYHLTGSRYDPPDIFGASFFYQTLMMGGTQSFDPMDGVNYTRRYGGDNDSVISYDYSSFFHLAPDEEIGNVLWYESERISSLKMADASIDRLKEILFNRFSFLEKNNQIYRHSNWVKEKLFAGTVYEKPVYGDLKKLNDIPNKDIRDIYQRYNNLADIILVITGNFNAWEIREAITKRFGPLGGDRKSARRKLEDVALPINYTFEIKHEENLSQPFVLYGVRAPARTDLEFLYFELVRIYLLDKRIAKLQDAINRVNNLDVSIEHEFTNHFGVNALIIKMSSPRRIDLEKARFIINDQLLLLAGNNKFMSDDEARDAKSLMELDFLKDIRDLRKRAVRLAESYALTGSPDLNPYLERIRKLSAWTPVRVRKYFHRENLIVLNVYPKT